MYSKTKKRFVVYFTGIILLLILSNGLAAQCVKNDAECWMQETITRIESGDTKGARRVLKNVKKRHSYALNEEAKEVKDKIKKVYQSLFEYKISADVKLATRHYQESLSLFQSAQRLAEQAQRRVTTNTKELDTRLLNDLNQRLSEVEKERKTAVETALTSANSAIDANEYRRALDQLLFVAREGTSEEKNTNDVRQKIKACRYHIALNSAKDQLEKQQCKEAFKSAEEALRYQISNDAKRVRDQAGLCAYDQLCGDGRQRLETGGKECELAIPFFEEALTYQSYASSSSNNASIGLEDAKTCAARHYLKEGVDAYGANNHLNAREAIQKAASFSSTASINFQDKTNTPGQLLNVLHDNLAERASNAYSEKQFDQSAQDYEGASIYRDSLEMIKKANFVQAVGKAWQLKQNLNNFQTINEFRALYDAWAKANALKDEAKITKGQINVVQMLSEAKDYYQAVQNADAKYRAAQVSNNTGQREAALVAIRTLPPQSKYRQAQLARMEKPVQGESLSTIMEFKRKNVTITPKFGEIDDRNLGGDAYVTTWVEFQKNPSNPSEITAKFGVNIKECRECHRKKKCKICVQYICHKCGTSFNNNNQHSIPLYEIPSKYRDHFKIGNASYLGRKFYFNYNGKPLNNVLLRKLEPVYNLSSQVHFFTNIRLVFEKDQPRLLLDLKQLNQNIIPK